MTFTAEEIRMLFELERSMDRGETPYIYVDGIKGRAAMDAETMKILGLKVGETISSVMWVHVLEFKIEQLNREIAHQQVNDIIAEENGGSDV